MKIKSLAEIAAVAKEFISRMGDKKVFVFYGSMGAGKTTFIKAICEALGVEDVITSPTFAIINEYNTQNGDQIFHFDFYRINKIEEAYDFGYEDYFYSGNLCFIEWPEKIKELIPPGAVEVHIVENAAGEREISLSTCKG
jgi:tRNA threonylcarbamoyladenosine biosynthesis protein TsaE